MNNGPNTRLEGKKERRTEEGGWVLSTLDISYLILSPDSH